MCLVWHPFNPERLASVSEDKTLRIWDIRQGKAEVTVQVPDGPLNIVWSPDAQHIVVGNKANLLTVILPESGTVFKSHKEAEEANEMHFSRNSQHLAVTSAIGLKIFKFPEMELYDQLDAHPAACATLDLDPRGRYLVIGSSDSIASLWDTTEWHCVRTITNQEYGFHLLRWKECVAQSALSNIQKLCSANGALFTRWRYAGVSDRGEMCRYRNSIYLCCIQTG